MEHKSMLTTFDNPFNPFVDFSSWYMYDCEKNYNTSSRLARIAIIDSEMTEQEKEDEMERAMNLIVKYDFEDRYIKGTEEQIEKWLNARRNGEVSLENDQMQTATAKNA